jgi:hypothetical protein
MKTLSAAAVAIAVIFALPTVGETAQKKKSKARYVAPTSQPYPSFSVPGSRTRAGTPCVTYTWRGCEGWDPDPRIRAMIDMDRGRDDR